MTNRVASEQGALSARFSGASATPTHADPSRRGPNASQPGCGVRSLFYAPVLAIIEFIAIGRVYVYLISNYRTSVGCVRVRVRVRPLARAGRPEIIVSLITITYK